MYSLKRMYIHWYKLITEANTYIQQTRTHTHITIKEINNDSQEKVNVLIIQSMTKGTSSSVNEHLAGRATRDSLLVLIFSSLLYESMVLFIQKKCLPISINQTYMPFTRCILGNKELNVDLHGSTLEHKQEKFIFFSEFYQYSCATIACNSTIIITPKSPWSANTIILSMDVNKKIQYL